MGIVNPIHLAFVALVALVVLGPKKFPDMARALGHGVREFRQAMSMASLNDPPPPIPPQNAIYQPHEQAGVFQQPRADAQPGAATVEPVPAAVVDPIAAQAQQSEPQQMAISYTDAPAAPQAPQPPAVAPATPGSEPQQPTAVG